MNAVFGTTRRVRAFADVDVQSWIVIRCSIYGFACVLYFSLMMLCSHWMQSPEAPLGSTLLRYAEDATYWLPGVFLLAPLAIHDLLKTSGRIVGPIVRLKNEMRLLIDHKSERPVEFREDDAWMELASMYNQLRGEVLMLRREVAEYEAMLGKAALSDLAPDWSPAAIQEDDALTALPQPANTAEAR
jgi:hypothetical protein